jgi:hypothetical protein
VELAAIGPLQASAAVLQAEIRLIKARSNELGSIRATNSICSPPPCGERLGVGVRVRTRRHVGMRQARLLFRSLEALFLDTNGSQFRQGVVAEISQNNNADPHPQPLPTRAHKGEGSAPSLRHRRASNPPGPAFSGRSPPRLLLHRAGRPYLAAGLESTFSILSLRAATVNGFIR